ncbi:MAG: Coenzyme F420 hydrogenase/dehydrogenase, beta subunit C-terminal domain [Planctomycetaceae bacterium]|nr:Coenzyme F420 hydrogenase/dehydrogenase, beta subunit C-terminal domain [Planctomycetaceae bacterium]
MGLDKSADSVLSRVEAHACVGCGLCAGMFPEHWQIGCDAFGSYAARASGKDAPSQARNLQGLAVCPFGDQGEDEDTIARRLFGSVPGIQHRRETGYFIRSFAGAVADEAQRAASTSGGIITWLVQDLLKSKAVDAAVCVGPGPSPDRLFEYKIIRTAEEIEQCRKSRYYPVELSQVIPRIRSGSERVVFVGLPCFVKAIRLACLADPILNKRIAYTIGLFCGHLKTRQFAQYLSRTCGVCDDAIKTVDFRKSIPGRNAWDYAFEVKTCQGQETLSREIRSLDVVGGNWSLNFFMLDACDCCDDVLSETADVSVGDAWLPEYAQDDRGTNIVICRNPELLERIVVAAGKGALNVSPIEVERVIESQAGGLRHRRQGLAYRLYLARRRKQWMPRKRVAPSRTSLPLFNRLIQRLRMQLKRRSRKMFYRYQDDPTLDRFLRAMRPWILLHNRLYWAHKKMRRMASLARKGVKRLVGRR